MSPEPAAYGTTEVAPVHVAESVTLDAFDGRPPQAGLGRTETAGAAPHPWTVGMTDPEAPAGK